MACETPTGSGDFAHLVAQLPQLRDDLGHMGPAAGLDLHFDADVAHGDVPEGARMLNVEHVRPVDGDDGGHLVQVTGPVPHHHREARQAPVRPQPAGR